MNKQKKIVTMIMALLIVFLSFPNYAVASESNNAEETNILVENMTRGDSRPTVGFNLLYGDYSFSVKNMYSYVYTNYYFTGTNKITVKIDSFSGTTRIGDTFFITLYKNDGTLVETKEIFGENIGTGSYTFYNLSTSTGYYVLFTCAIYHSPISFSGYVYYI